MMYEQSKPEPLIHPLIQQWKKEQEVEDKTNQENEMDLEYQLPFCRAGYHDEDDYIEDDEDDENDSTTNNVCPSSSDPLTIDNKDDKARIQWSWQCLFDLAYCVSTCLLVVWYVPSGYVIAAGIVGLFFLANAKPATTTLTTPITST
jgi:hypothetical protein